MTIRAFITGLRRGIPAPAGMRGRCRWFVVGAIAWAWLAVSGLGPTASAEPAPEPIDDGVFLPTDRELERSLDKARRLLSDGRWSDAATLFDEILAAPRDAFASASPGRSTSRSLKTDAWAVLLEQPRAGRDAYELLFSARAERRLADALVADDMEAVVDVARRWFATPAGRRAAVIAAITALEAEQPAVAAAWLDRLAEQKAGEPVEPTLSLMRSVAHAQAGDMATAVAILETARGRDRVAGAEITLSLPPARAAAWLGSIARSRAARADEWPQPRGDAARNATVVASRPLLVPRYRVPLARHPEEVRLLDKRRQVAAAAERFVMPAGTPVAIDGLILVRTPLGILAVDFVTGKRVWLRPLDDQGPGPLQAEAVGADESGGDATEFTFDDLTSAGLTAAGGLVFAVESPPPAVGERGPLGDFNAAPRPRRLGDTGRRGNRLRAFAIAARGAARWQLPAADSDAWYLGPPLAVGRELYVLVEEKGEVRLDVLSADRGTLVWSQPLAELDEDEQITSQRSRPRRLAGLSPALADGVLVCPLGTGTVVAVDLATRRLLWAHRYARVDRPDADRAGGPDAATGSRRGPAAGDSLPVLAAGRVFLTAHDATGLICLDLRQGRPAWEAAVPGVVQVAGVVDDRVIVIGQRRVEARGIADGGLLWQVSYADAGGRPSGRGIMTPDRLLLPLDSPEVVEIDLRTGAIAGRCPARGGLVPGNLVAYRGEVISRGSDSLDVFHQTAALDTRIRTAESQDPESPWVWQWRGHQALEAGRVADGLALLGKAARAVGHRLPPETLPDAIVFGMQRDFAAAAPAWREAFQMASLEPGGSAAARAAARVAVDGFLRAESWRDAWSAIQDLLVNDPAAMTATRDPADPTVVVSDDRWLAGRLTAVIDRSPPALRAEITAAAEAAVDAAAAAADATDRMQRLESLAERLVSLPAGRRARELAVAAIEARGDDSTRSVIRREWHLLHLARSSASDTRDSARTAVVAGRPDSLRSRGDAASADRDWPLGRVDYRRLPIGRDTFAGEGRSRLMPLPVDVDRDTAVPGLRLACDVQEGKLHVFDGYGRPLLDPLTIDPAGARLGLPWLPQANGFEAWTLGRLLVVRTGRALSAYDLGGGSRALWTHAITGSAADQQPAGLWVRDVGGRGGRHGGNPLGLEITEPDDRSRTGRPRGGRPRITGALHQSGGTVSLVDPCTGTLLWERHALPAASELVGDDEFVTVCTASGADSRVLSMLDGHLVRTVTVPPRRQRLGTSGRRIVALRPLGDAAGRSVAATVQLELVDPVTTDTTVLGTVAGDARAVPLDDDRLAVLAADGQLIVFDPAAGRRGFETRLPAMPTAFDRLHVVAWGDRLLVIAGTESQSESGEWLPGLGDLAPLQHLLAAGEISRPLSGGIWAVDSNDGRLLWPGPATLDRHSLHLAQPAGLPVLLLSRQARSRPDADEVKLSLVGLDKRTGHAVFEEAAQPIHAHVFFGCELVGDPDRHSITVRESGETPRWAVLEFTGGPMPPRPPYQARRAMPDMDRLIEQMQSWRRQRP